MGLRPNAAPSGLAALLDSQSSKDSSALTSLDLMKLSTSLESALDYVFLPAAAAADSVSAARPSLVREGHIDYDAVQQHVQQALLSVAGLEEAAPSAQSADSRPTDVATPAAGEGPRNQSAGGSSSSGSGREGDEVPGVPAGRGRGADSDGSSPAAASPPPALEDAPEPEPAPAASGRLGLPDVRLVEARGNCDIQGFHVSSRTNFSTVRSSVCVFKGRWMYEVQLGSSGIMQLGWTTLQARFNSEEGVGDNQDSYAYDGRRKMRWHVSNAAYGEHWTAGDVIGCCIDLDAGSMRFLRNGKDLGEAFSNVRHGMPGMAYFAGVSMSYAERCEINFGARPFLHAVEGYQPLQQQPLQALSLPGDRHAESAPGQAWQGQLAAAKYLAGCLSRLTDVSSPAAAKPAADAAGGVMPGAGMAEALGSGAGGAAARQGAAAVAASAARHPSSHLLPGGLLLPEADMLAALAEAAGEPGTSKSAAPAVAEALPLGGGSWSPAGGSRAAQFGPAAGAAIRMDDRVLLGSVLAEHLGPMCFEPYLVEAVLLPFLDDTAGELSCCSSGGAAVGSSEDAGSKPAPAADAEARGGSGSNAAAEAPEAGDGIEAAAAGESRKTWEEGEGLELGRQRLGQLLGLLAAVLEPAELSALAGTCCQVLSRRVRGCVWSVADMPFSPALSALRLWSAMLDCPEVRAAWLTSGDWVQQLEQLMAVRQPGEDDLAELMSNLKVVWSDDDAGVVRNNREDQSVFAKDIGRLTQGLEQVEAAQADVLLQIWLEGGDNSSSSTCSSAGSSCDDEYSSVASGSHHSSSSGSAYGEGSQRERAPSDDAAAAIPMAAPEAATQSASETATVPQPDRGRYLCQFLWYLIDKNHGAMRHTPPPGLSDETSLVATVFALLRLMNEQVAAALPLVPALRWDPSTNFLEATSYRPPALRGGPLRGGGDPYFDIGRVGGTLSHLAREHPPTDEERRPLEELPLGAVVKYDAPLRLRAHALEGPSFSNVWLFDRILMLCHLSVAPLMRSSLSHLTCMQNAMSGLRAVAASQAATGTSRMLNQTRRDCRQEFVRSLRHHEWAQCWLLAPWRQQTAFVLSVAAAQLVAAVAARPGALLRYVPEFYISSLLDMVHAVHRCEPSVLDHQAMLGLGLRHIVEFVVSHLEDERVVSPEVQARLMHMVLEGVQELDLLKELGSNAVARRCLLPALMRVFARPHLWGQASNFFALLVEGCGFLHPPAAYPPQFVGPVTQLRQLFKQACLEDAELCSAFLHHLFDHVNRMLTELVASLESMESSMRPGGAGAPSSQLLRLLTSTADYALVLLRTLELMAAEMPQLFLGPGSGVNMTQVAEVLGFAVPHFVSGRAGQALQRLASYRAVSQQLRLRSAHMLQPLAGLVVALWEAEQEQAAGSSSDTPASGPGGSAAAGAEAGTSSGEAADGSFPMQQQRQQPAKRGHLLLQAVGKQPALTDDVLRGLLSARLAEVEPLSPEAAAAEQAKPAAQQELSRKEAMQRLSNAVESLLATRSAAAAAAAVFRVTRGGGGGTPGTDAMGGVSEDVEVAEAPDEFLDPILSTLMLDPVTLPDSRVTLDRSTIERHLRSSATDPFSRAPLAKEQLIPNTALLHKIEEWQQQQHSHS
ncbi:E3 ubiquitin-protein ligase RNF123 [Chlorella vulgaris]